MFKHIILFLLLVTLVSCYNENKPPVIEPERLLSEKELISVLTDIQIAESIVIHNQKNHAKLGDGYNDSLFQVVFDQYGITGELLRENLNYYNINPRFMEGVYNEVLANLIKQQSEIQIEAEIIESAKKAVREAAERMAKQQEETELTDKENDSIS